MTIPAGPLALAAAAGDRPWATFTDPAGTIWDLTNTDPDVGYFTRNGPAGWGAVTYEFVTDPGRNGETVRHIRAKPARITWPLHIHGEDLHGDVNHLVWLDRYRAIKRAFMMTVHRGEPGVLRVTRPDKDNTAREIECFYEDGFTGEAGEDFLYSNPVITLYAPDGYWRATKKEVVPRKYNPGTSFLSGFPQVSAGAVLGVSTIDNVGDVEAWPVWTITGPADVITATNNTTGRQFTLSYTIGAGQMIVIDTEQGTMRGPVGENLVNALNWPSASLWSLRDGTNKVDFSVSGAGAGTAIELAYYPRFEGA